MTAYRNEGLATLVKVVAFVFAAGAIVFAIVNDEPGLSTASRWAPAVVVVAISLFCLLRLARAGAYAGDEGVRVVNPLRTVRLDWDSIMRFTLRPHKGFPALGFVELFDGSKVEIWGIQSRSRAPSALRGNEELIESLNERLAQERARRRPPEGGP